MKRLLFLTHRIPYPPNKGDKISGFQMLRYFSKKYEVVLAAFIDDPEDIQYKDLVSEYCIDSHFSVISPKWRRLASLAGGLSGAPLSVAYYRDRAFEVFIDHQLTAHQPDIVFVFSGAMGRFIDGRICTLTRFIYSMEDVDSEKFKAYAAVKAPPLNWIYQREARKLLEFERHIAAQSTATILVSDAEAELFRRLAPESAPRITDRRQGVDTDYFDPAGNYPSPYEPAEKPLLFTGAMDYPPNIEAVTWFADHVMPSLKQRIPEASFYIVGMRPSPAVKKLADLPGVTVTGKVEDVRPYLHHAHAACLPLQIARGIQNKILEAMAMQKTVIATPAALTGIAASSLFQPIIAQSPDSFIEACSLVLTQAPRRDETAREYCRSNFSWESNLAALEQLFDAPETPIQNGL